MYLKQVFSREPIWRRNIILASRNRNCCEKRILFDIHEIEGSYLSYRGSWKQKSVAFHAQRAKAIRDKLVWQRRIPNCRVREPRYKNEKAEKNRATKLIIAYKCYREPLIGPAETKANFK